MNERIYTPAELAELLGVDEKTLWREQSRGLLPFRRVGRAVRFTEKDLRDYLDRTRRNAA